MPLYPAPAVVALGRVALGSAQPTITFAGIPQQFATLQLIVMGRSTDSTNDNHNLLLRFAASGTSYDSGANYDWVAMNGSGTSTVNVEGIAATSLVVGGLSAGLAPAGAAGAFEILIPGYAGSTFHKVTASRGGRKHQAASAGLRVNNLSGHWRNTAPIVALELSLAAGSFEAGSVATLYGLR